MRLSCGEMDSLVHLWNRGSLSSSRTQGKAPKCG